LHCLHWMLRRDWVSRDHLIGAMRHHPAPADAYSVEMQAEPGWCRFRVRGELPSSMLAAFPYLHAMVMGSDTVLTGPVPDQAALHGVLAQLEALGIELIELRRAKP
jgi:hypothetical protein